MGTRHVWVIRTNVHAHDSCALVLDVLFSVRYQRLTGHSTEHVVGKINVRQNAFKNSRLKVLELLNRIVNIPVLNRNRCRFDSSQFSWVWMLFLGCFERLIKLRAGFEKLTQLASSYPETIL